MYLGNLILLTVAGYSLLSIHDASQIRPFPVLKGITYSGYAVIALPYLFIAMQHDRDQYLRSPLPLLIILAVLLLALLVLLVYSVFIEIPLMTRQNGHQESAPLYRRGTYAISRHPGFLWLTAIHVMLGLLFREKSVVILLAFMTFCNLALIIFEDLVVFPKIFPQYAEYRKEVAFFIQLPRK